MNLEVYDFRRINRMPESLIRALRLQHESLARDLVSTLSAFLRMYVVVRLAGIRQTSFGEFRQGLSAPTCVAKLSAIPAGTGAALEITHSLVFPIIEILLGGTGQASAGIERETTEIEKKLLKEFLEIVLRAANGVWQPATGVEYQVQEIETDPQMIRILMPGDAVLVVAFELAFGQVAGSINLAVPFNLFTNMHFTERDRAARESAAVSDRHAVLDVLRWAPLSLDAQLVGAKMRLREVVALKQGEILEFDHGLDEPVDLTVNRIPKMRGRIVASNDKRAFFVERISSDDRREL